MAEGTAIWVFSRSSERSENICGWVEKYSRTRGKFPNSFTKLPKRSRAGLWCCKSGWLLVSLLVTEMITEKFQLLKCAVSWMEDQGAGFSKGSMWVSNLSKFSFLTTENTGWTVGVNSEGAMLWWRKKEQEIDSSVFLERPLYRKTLTWVKGLASLFWLVQRRVKASKMIML